jgi:hypothetical protein
MTPNKKKKKKKKMNMRHNNPTMARFKYTDNGQGQFIAVNLKEQIALGTFEWTVSHIIDCMRRVHTQEPAFAGEL